MFSILIVCFFAYVALEVGIIYSSLDFKLSETELAVCLLDQFKDFP